MSNKFWKGMLLGALAGGAISLLDKETRLAMKENCLMASEVIKNPGQIVDQVKETALKIKTTIEEISEDFSYISEKVEDLCETTPEMVKTIKETKEAFSKNGEKDPDDEAWEL